jgi:hypothetical protein
MAMILPRSSVMFPVLAMVYHRLLIVPYVLLVVVVLSSFHGMLPMLTHPINANSP